MTRVFLVRHGESNATVEGRIGGPSTCSGLSPLGRRQVRALAERLQRTGEVDADVLVASTLRRAVETAELLAPSLGGLPVELDGELCEQDPGPACDGLTWEEYQRRFGKEPWPADPDEAGFPGGETVSAFHQRVRGALTRLAETHPGRTVLVACHGGVIEVAVRYALGSPFTGTFELWTTNASLTEAVKEEVGWRLARYNDAAHLHGLPARTPRQAPAG